MKQGIKRSITAVLAITIYILLMFGTVYAVVPSGDFRMERLARDEDGTVYVAGFAGNEAIVCRIDENGILDRYYRCRREAPDAGLLCQCYDGRIYLCQVWYEDGDGAKTPQQRFSIWERSEGGFQCILQGTVENRTEFTDIMVDERGISLAGIDLQTDEILICRLQNEELQIQRYRTDFVPVKACFGEDSLYLLSDQGQMCMTRREGTRQTWSSLGEAAELFTDGQGMYWQPVGSRDINYLLYESVQGYVFQDMGYMQDIACSSHSPNLAVLLGEDEGNRLLTADWDGSGGKYVPVDVTGWTPELIAANAMVPMLMVTLAYITVWIASVLLTRLIRDRNGLLYKAMAAVIKISGTGLVAIMALVHFQGGESYSGMILVAAAIMEWLTVLIITLFFLRHIWKNADIIVAWMDKISRGEYGIEGRKAPGDEFGRMWTSLERMCRSLQMRRYRQVEVTDYLYQYAPRNFERLFGKASLHDIEIGETRQLPVTVGMISIIDKGTLLTGRIQRQYMQYINGLMDLLFSQRDSGQAIFLQDGSNMENVKVVFQGGDESVPVAVRYSIECMEALLRRTEAQYGTTPFILLHTATVSCGLAGGSRQVYPYVTSLETETLAGFAGRLKESGVRIAVTESTWQQIQGQAEGRYIGYVASRDRKYVFRLYEILDPCPQSQKLGRIRNRERFEQALELFYNNDLYLARSAFAEVLRECPDDGISEWYVFACDELFNEGDGADKGYDLFGREEFR